MNIRKVIIGACGALLCLGLWLSLPVINSTLYLTFHWVTYLFIAIVALLILWVRFKKGRGKMSTGEYVGESLAASGALVLIYFLILPASVAALNRYIPCRDITEYLHCTITEKRLSYQRGGKHRYVTFSRSDSAPQFTLKVNGKEYRLLHENATYTVEIRTGALGYPIVTSISR